MKGVCPRITAVLIAALEVFARDHDLSQAEALRRLLTEGLARRGRPRSAQERSSAAARTRSGMARHHFRLPADLLAALKRHADSKGLSRDAAMRELLRAGLVRKRYLPRTRPRKS